MAWWSGYWRKVRHREHDFSVFVPRVRCKPCVVTHALLPAFVLTKRLYDAETIGAVIEDSIDGSSGVRPAASRHRVVHETARHWVRRFRQRAPHLASSFAALAVDLGAEALVPEGDTALYALSAVRSVFDAATNLPGWADLGMWRLCSAVSGGALLATNTICPYLVVGKRRFMPPVPKANERNESDGP